MKLRTPFTGLLLLLALPASADSSQKWDPERTSYHVEECFELVDRHLIKGKVYRNLNRRGWELMKARGPDRPSALRYLETYQWVLRLGPRRCLPEGPARDEALAKVEPLIRAKALEPWLARHLDGQVEEGRREEAER